VLLYVWLICLKYNIPIICRGFVKTGILSGQYYTAGNTGASFTRVPSPAIPRVIHARPLTGNTGASFTRVPSQATPARHFF
jgi:hypothetical protein